MTRAIALARDEFAAYTALFSRALKASFAYRQSLFTSMLATAIGYAVPLFVWRHVYRANPGSALVSARELFPYLLLASCLNYALTMNVENRVGSRIRMGLIATDLLKPIDFQFAQLAHALSDGLFNVFLTLPIAFVAALFLGQALAPASVWLFGYFALSTIFAFAVAFGISFVLVQAAFYTQTGYGIHVSRLALQQTFSGVAAPLLLYPEWLRNTAHFLPFRHTIHTPLSIYMGWLRGGEIVRALLAQLLWAVGLFLLGRWLLRRSLRRLEIQGG